MIWTGTRTHLNATLRWRVASRQLDGGCTTDKSSPVVSTNIKKPRRMAWFFWLYVNSWGRDKKMRMCFPVGWNSRTPGDGCLREVCPGRQPGVDGICGHPGTGVPTRLFLVSLSSIFVDCYRCIPRSRHNPVGYGSHDRNIGPARCSGRIPCCKTV